MNLLDQFKKINTFVFDMDGVLTDGALFVVENSQPVRRMNIKDGYAIQLAIKKGYKIIVISGSISDAVVTRLNGLGVKDVYMKVEEKATHLDNILKENNTGLNEVLFMGDDLPDYAAMKIVGLPCSPADAAAEIKEIAKYISPLNGGHGCVRDVIEKVLKLNGHWQHETGIVSR